MDFEGSLDQHGGQLQGRNVAAMSYLYLVLQDSDIDTVDSWDVDENGVDVRNTGGTVNVANEEGAEVVWLGGRTRLQRLFGDHLQMSVPGR